MSKRILEFKNQETHNRMKEVSKLLWRQQNFHRSVQHPLNAALLSMFRCIEFLFFQWLSQPELVFTGYYLLIVLQSVTIARYHSRFTRIILLLNENAEIIKFVLQFLCILYFNLSIKNWSVRKANLFDAKKKCVCKIKKFVGSGRFLFLKNISS